MHKKYHKLHHHKDPAQKHSSKSKNRHKHGRSHSRALSTNKLEPIVEQERRRVEGIDQNACGDFEQKKHEDVHRKSSKRHRKKSKSIKDERHAIPPKDNERVFLEKFIEKPDEYRISTARHQSLEKNDDSLIIKTKKLFRREKSFDDAYKKDTDDNIEIKSDTDFTKIEKERRHRHIRKESKEKRNKKDRNKDKQSNKSRDKSKVDESETKHRKEKKSHRKKSKNKEKSLQEDHTFVGGVQEVVFCQIQAPYKMKNDKSASEIKDLYQRINRDKHRRSGREERRKEDKPHSYSKSKKRDMVEKDRSNSLKCEDRSKGRAERHSNDRQDGDRYKSIDVKEKYMKKMQSDFCGQEKMATSRKSRRDNDGRISLGPYENLFAFEKQGKIKDMESGDTREDNRELSERRRLRRMEKDAVKSAPVKDSFKTDEDKIHEIIEGDLKSYFIKIQTMIDQKLDVILQNSKLKQQEEINDGKRKVESRSLRSRSAKKERHSIKDDVKADRHRSEKEKEDVRCKDTERKHEKEHKKVTKEEIVEEVLKRIKKEEHHNKTNRDKSSYRGKDKRHKSRSETREKSHKYDSQTEKDAKYIERIHKAGGKDVPYRDKEKRHKSSSKEANVDGLLESTGFVTKYPKNDDLHYSKTISGPPPDLLIPPDLCSLAREKHLKSRNRHRSPHHLPSRSQDHPSLYPLCKQYPSGSSCRAYSEHHFATPRIGRQRSEEFAVQSKKKTETLEEQRHGQKGYLMPKNGVPVDRMRSEDDVELEHGRKALANSGEYHQCRMKDIETPVGLRAYPGELDEHFRQIPCQKPVPGGEKSFRRHDFVVHGIEPPSLESSRRKSRQKMHSRKLECKTVSIIGIPPQENILELTLAHQTQTSSKSRKSSLLENDLVEKRKKSKRFKLYYKYSVQDNSKEERGMSSSDAKSIVSDSYRVVSDPSEVIYGQGKIEECPSSLDGSEIVEKLAKKRNKLVTPRDSHLKNIIEEPSIISSGSLRDGEYFIPLKGTKECYFKALTSSTSEYCFKINKKPASSKISVVSKDTRAARYKTAGERNKYYKKVIRSKSDFRIAPKMTCSVFRSRSDVFVGGVSGKQIIKSIFLEDSLFFVKSRRDRKKSMVNCFGKVLEAKDIALGTSKECQTSDLRVFDDVTNRFDDGERLAFENKQDQFKEIYKTIDNLEENVMSSRKQAPKTVDVAVSSKFLSLDDVSDKKPQFAEIYKTIDNLEDRIQTTKRHSTKTVDVAIGSSRKNSRSQKSSTCEQRTEKRDIGIAATAQNVDSFKNNGKILKSTGVSPVRIMEDKDLQVESIPRKATTPKSPDLKHLNPKHTVWRRSRNTPETSSFRRPVTKEMQVKNTPAHRHVRPKVILMRDEPPTSPAECSNVGDVKSSDAQREHRRILSQERGTNVRERNNFSGGPDERTCHKLEGHKHRKSNLTDVVGRSENKKHITEDYKPIVDVNRDQKDTSKRSVGSARLEANNPSRPEDQRGVITSAVGRVHERKPSQEKRNYTRENSNVSKASQSQKPVGDTNKSCVHHNYSKDHKSRLTSVTDRKTPIVSISKPLTVNTAVFEYQNLTRKKLVAVDSTTSSSVSDGMPQNIRKSMSLVEIRTQKKIASVIASKSELCRVGKSVSQKNIELMSKDEGSDLSNMEKFTTKPKLKCQASKSNVHSLDQYMGNKFTSRLFLTKDFKGSEISSYQKRKLYDQAIRQKMKKKFRFSKMDVGPQIFEVRFLSMMNQGKQNETIRYFDRPVIALKNLSRVKTEGSIYKKRFNSSEPETPNLVLDKTDRAAEIVRAKADAHSGSLKGRTTDNIKRIGKIDDKEDCSQESSLKVTQIFIKDEKGDHQKMLNFCQKLLDVNSNLSLPEKLKEKQCNCASYSENCEACQNFVNLLDMLCSSIATYCSPKTNIMQCKVDEKEDNVENSLIYTQGTCPEFKEVCFNSDQNYNNQNCNIVDIEGNDSNQVDRKIVEELFPSSFNQHSTDSNDSNIICTRFYKNPTHCVSLESTTRSSELPCLTQPMSCPVLPSNASSFEYLYEEESSSDHDDGISREAMFANLTRPFDQTFNLSLSQYNVETPFFRGRSFDSSPTGSEESGYASVKSKVKGNAGSLTNFFKKPNIAALFKPPTRKKIDFEGEQNKYCKSGVLGEEQKEIVYEKMAKECHLYAKKVREYCEEKCGKTEVFREISLAVLLGKNSSVILETLPMREEVLVETDVNALEGNLVDVQYINVEKDCSNVNMGEESENKDAIFLAENGCKIVLSNECLRVESVTYFEADIFANNSDKTSNVYKDLSINSSGSIVKPQDFNFVSILDNVNDFSILINDNDSFEMTNPFVNNKMTIAQKFFAALLKVYEKEMEICNRLFQDDDFLKNHLLSAVKQRKNRGNKTKKGRFSRFFRKKARVQENCVENDNTKVSDQSEASIKLQKLAFNARRCFTMLAEAVRMNDNIDDEIKICGLLKLLERIESGEFQMLQNDQSFNFEEDMKCQITEAFITIYDICQQEAKKKKRKLDDKDINMIKAFVSKYRIGLLSKTDVVACYIGRGVIQSESQLKAAVTYLMRSQNSEIDAKEFEEYCKFTFA